MDFGARGVNIFEFHRLKAAALSHLPGVPAFALKNLNPC